MDKNITNSSSPLISITHKNESTVKVIDLRKVISIDYDNETLTVRTVSSKADFSTSPISKQEYQELISLWEKWA